MSVIVPVTLEAKRIRSMVPGLLLAAAAASACAQRDFRLAGVTSNADCEVVAMRARAGSERRGYSRGPRWRRIA